MYNIESTVLSQFANSPSIMALIADFQEWIDPTINLQSFYADWWNIETAAGVALDNWGQILGVSRNLNLPNQGQYVGFYNTANDYQPMSQAPFYSGGSATNTYALTDSSYRTLLLAKALYNITNCGIPALNTLAQAVFGKGSMHVVDNGNMTMLYRFDILPTLLQQAIAGNSGVLPNPTGVSQSISVPTWAWTLVGTATETGIAQLQKASGGSTADSYAILTTDYNVVWFRWTVQGITGISFNGLHNASALSGGGPYVEPYYTILCQENAWYIYVNSVLVGPNGTINDGDTFEVKADGTYVYFFYNGGLVYTTSQVSSTLYPAALFSVVGAVLENIFIQTL